MKTQTWQVETLTNGWRFKCAKNNNLFSLRSQHGLRTLACVWACMYGFLTHGLDQLCTIFFFLEASLAPRQPIFHGRKGRMQAQMCSPTLFQDALLLQSVMPRLIIEHAVDQILNLGKNTSAVDPNGSTLGVHAAYLLVHQKFVAKFASSHR